MRFMKDEEAVSPVIGVILMVAITVILAAVIAVFVFGLAGDLESGAQKDVQLTTGTTSTGDVTFTVFSGNDVNKLDKLIALRGDSSTTMADGAGAISIGLKYDTGFKKSDGKVTAIGEFNDGTRQVLAESS